MARHWRAALVGIVCFAMGAGIQRWYDSRTLVAPSSTAVMPPLRTEAPPPWIRVVETTHVPKTRIVGNLFLADDHTRTEPIAGRIIEVPEDIAAYVSSRKPPRVALRRTRSAS